MKYTDQQLSKILSAHAAKKLAKYGRQWVGHDQISSNLNLSANDTTGCINQHAYNIDNRWVAKKKNNEMAIWFDCFYENNWSVDKFLAELLHAQNY